jgi:hypothetical protein
MLTVVVGSAGGSTIAQMVGQYGWRPMIYLNPRGPGEKREFDPANPAKGYLIFANFVTNWYHPTPYAFEIY